MLFSRLVIASLAGGFALACGPGQGNVVATTTQPVAPSDNWELRQYVSKVRSSEPLGKFVVVGYAPDYRLSTLKLRALGKLYTDVILFSVQPDPDKVLDQSTLKDASTWSTYLKYAGVKRVLVAVGGGDGRSEGFPTMVATATNRTALANQLLAFCLDQHLDGVDLDCEPRGITKVAGYPEFIEELAKKFHPKGLLVTAALNIEQNLTPAAYQALDRVHLMAYDGPEHATLEFAEKAINIMRWNGVPANKLVLGVPFYGLIRGTGNAKAYSEIEEQYPVTEHDDVVASYNLNGPITLTKKVQLAREKGLAGVMAWEITQDTSDYVLSTTLRHAAGE